jgi:hypothetical protein
MELEKNPVKVIEWGSVPLGATPHKNVKTWYDRDPSSFCGVTMEAHVHARECTGLPAYRVNPKTKNHKGAGSRSNCSECHKITNFYCLRCRRWLCSPQLATNRNLENNGKNVKDAPKFFKISFKGKKHVKDEGICAIYSCWHKAHEEGLKTEGEFARGWCNFANDDVSSMTSF